MDEQERQPGQDAIADQVVEELQKVAFASFGDVADVVEAEIWRLQDGIPPKDLPAVASVKIKASGKTVEREVRMYDKLKALEMLAKIHGMYDGGGRAGAEVPVIIDDIADPPTCEESV